MQGADGQLVMSVSGTPSVVPNTDFYNPEAQSLYMPATEVIPGQLKAGTVKKVRESN
jgi:hypothetical protein